MVLKMDQRTAIHHHLITLHGNLGITKEIEKGERKKRKDSRAYPRERCVVKEECARSCGSAPESQFSNVVGK